MFYCRQALRLSPTSLHGLLSTCGDSRTTVTGHLLRIRGRMAAGLIEECNAVSEGARLRFEEWTGLHGCRPWTRVVNPEPDTRDWLREGIADPLRDRRDAVNPRAPLEQATLFLENRGGR